MKKIQLLLQKIHVPLSKPKNLKDSDSAIFTNNNVWECGIDEVFVLQYQNVSVDGHGLAFYRDSKKRKRLLFNNRSQFSISKMYWKIRSFIHALFSTNKVYKEAILLTDLDSHAYFHWIADVLPKIIVLFDSSDTTFKKLPIIFPEKALKSYAFETLELFLKDNEMVIVPYWRKVRVKTLYSIPSVAQPSGSGNYRPAVMYAIREKMLQHLAENGTYIRQLQNKVGSVIQGDSPLRIYFSRKDAKYRYLKNEREVLPLLKKYGFLYVEAGKYSVWEQALLCNKANVIVGLHGAALTNMIWMNEGSKVIEIRKENDSHNNCYFSLASAMSLDYYYLFAKGDRADTHKSNFYVNVDTLEAVLKEVI